MTQNTYTEDEFKKVLKNLFTEKKRVKDLEKQIEEKGLQKRFQAKLTDIHKLSLTEEYAKLKAAYLEKETECDSLKRQLEKVRPALKKLVVDLKSATAEIATLKGQPPNIQTDLTEALTGAQHQVEILQENQRRLEGELTEHVGHLQRQTERLAEQREELAQALIRAAEAEDALRHVQSETDYQLTALCAEREVLLAKIGKVEQEWVRDRQIFTTQAEKWKEGEEELKRIRSELEAAQAELLKSDYNQLRTQYEMKMQETLIALSQKEAAHEEALESSYGKMRELAQRHAEMIEEREQLRRQVEDHSKFLVKFEKEQVLLQSNLKNAKLHCEEQEAELQKAQLHLAKKIKESTILRDLVERQRIQLLEMQAALDKQAHELERMQNNAHLQRLHEEKLQEMSKERMAATELVAKEWQDKFFALQQDWQAQKGELIELQKLRKTYDQMSLTFSSLQTLLGNPVGLSPPEKTEDSGN